MGLLSRLSEWIASLTGGSERDDAEAAPDDATEGAVRDDAGDRGDGPPDDTGSEDDGSPDDAGSTGLDPSAVAETRTTANDDAVDALREVRRSQTAGADADGDRESDPAGGPDPGESDDTEGASDGESVSGSSDTADDTHDGRGES